MGLFGRKKKNKQVASDYNDKYDSLHAIGKYEESIACYNDSMVANLLV